MTRIPLLLDVDGVINVMKPRGQRWAFETKRHLVLDGSGEAWPFTIPTHLPDWLAELAQLFEVVWCTSWANANEAVSPLVGLPTDLDMVELPTPTWDVLAQVPPAFCYKTPHVRQWAGQRKVTSLAWIDDEVHRVDRDALSRSIPPTKPLSPWEKQLVLSPPISGRVLTVTVDQHRGPVRKDIDLLLAMATT